MVILSLGKPVVVLTSSVGGARGDTCEGEPAVGARAVREPVVSPSVGGTYSLPRG